MVPDPRQVFDASAANHYHRVLLQVMPLARNVGGYLHAVGETHPRDFTKRGVRFFGSHGGYFYANAPLERRGVVHRMVFLYVKTALESRRFAFGTL